MRREPIDFEARKGEGSERESTVAKGERKRGKKEERKRKTSLFVGFEERDRVFEGKGG